MSDQKNVLPVTGLDFLTVDIEYPLQDTKLRACGDLMNSFAQARAQASNEGHTLESKVFESLMILTGFRQNFNDQANPYMPLYTESDKRSAIPEDLSIADLDTIAVFWNRSTFPLLRARLGDILFIRRKNHKAALDAVTQYINAGNSILSSQHWFFGAELFKRALQLAKYLGQGKEPWEKAEKVLLNALESPFATSENYFSCNLLSVAEEFGLGEPITLSEIAHKNAEKANNQKDYLREREYLLLEASFLDHAGKKDEATKSRLLVAESYINESNAALQRPESSFSVAAHFLAQGIEVLRQSGESPARISVLQKRLLDYQRKSVKSMHVLGYSVDVSETANAVRKYLQVPKLEDAIERFTLGFSIIDIEELREAVLETAKLAPFSNFIGTDVVDRQGRVQKSLSPLFGATGKQAEKELENRVFQDATRSVWPIRAGGIIQPGRTQIWNDHAFTASDIAYLVRHNPFIPPGHENIFLRGLFYGFAGDMLLATHLLVPQLENSIRYVLECNGADVTNLMSDLTQPVKLLGPLFDLPEMEKIFGENMKFELRGLLIEKTGYGLRNNLAHGFITEEEGYGVAAVNCWWLTLRLCVAGVKIIEEQEDAS